MYKEARTASVLSLKGKLLVLMGGGFLTTSLLNNLSTTVRLSKSLSRKHRRDEIQPSVAEEEPTVPVSET